MKLKSYQLNNVAQPSRQNQDWSNKFITTSHKQKFQPDTWVQLLELPSKYSFEEALLLCQMSPDEWVAWIPDHGEAVLKESQFCAVC